MIIEEFSHASLTSEQLFERLRNVSIAEVKTLIYKVEDLLAAEPLLASIEPCTAIVVGDMHGDIAACLTIARMILEDPELHAIFLGDYVDRGPHQVDVINLVLLLKLTFPDRVLLLRGNHETPLINDANGFRECLHRQFGTPDTKILWHLYNRLFKSLPLAAISWNRIFFVHGGIPEGLASISEIETLPREFDPSDPRVLELLWNDPDSSRKSTGFKKSARGGVAKKFGEAKFLEFIQGMNVTLVIRAHEEFNDGYRYFFNDKLLSIYSSRRAMDSPLNKQIKPKILRLWKDGTICIDMIEPEVIQDGRMI
jgi:diadenosine tetraphosphatase ApaH/serine/threonine PP2A family protein phosphatase